MTTTVETANAGSKAKLVMTSYYQNINPIPTEAIDDNGLLTTDINFIVSKTFSMKRYMKYLYQKLITDDWEDAHPYEERTLYDYYFYTEHIG